MKQVRSTIRMCSEAAPIITLAALLLVPYVLPNRTTFDPRIEARRMAVAETMLAIPHAIGSWVGTDIEIPPAAIKLLHPNAILSRRYQRIPDGPTASVLMVHCSDARDMLGHYPPVCYPASGWTPDEQNARTATLTTIGKAIPVRVYGFTRQLNLGRRAQIRIFNFFILPDGSIADEMHAVQAQSERLTMSLEGTAQVQIITSGDTSLSDATEAAEQLLGGMQDLFHLLEAGGQSKP